MRILVLVKLALAAMAFLAAGLPAMAVTISLEPTSQTVSVGNPVEVILEASGLGDGTAPSLSTFDIDVAFGDDVLAFTGTTFGDPVLGDQLDVLGLGSITEVTETAPGTVNLFELSLDSTSDLRALQAPAFTLAVLEFDTIAVGNAALDVSVNALGDANGDPLPAASVNVVPEPHVSGLLLLGLASLATYHRPRAG